MIKPILNTVTNLDDRLQIRLNWKEVCYWQWMGNIFQAKIFTKNKPKRWKNVDISLFKILERSVRNVWPIFGRRGNQKNLLRLARKDAFSSGSLPIPEANALRNEKVIRASVHLTHLEDSCLLSRPWDLTVSNIFYE